MKFTSYIFLFMFFISFASSFDDFTYNNLEPLNYSTNIVYNVTNHSLTTDELLGFNKNNYVPYQGATEDLNLSDHNLNVNNLTISKEFKFYVDYTTKFIIQSLSPYQTLFFKDFGTINFSSSTIYAQTLKSTSVWADIGFFYNRLMVGGNGTFLGQVSAKDPIESYHLTTKNYTDSNFYPLSNPFNYINETTPTDLTDYNNKSEADKRFITDSNSMNLIGNGRFYYTSSSGSPFEWTGFDSSISKVVSSTVTLQENGLITKMDNSSWHYSTPWGINLTVSGVNLTDPFITERYVVLYGTTSTYLKGYSLEIEKVFPSENIITVKVPIAYNMQQRWNVINYHPQNVTGEHFNISTIASRSGKAFMFENGKLTRNKQIKTNYILFDASKPLAISFEYLTLNTSKINTAYKNHYMQLEISDKHHRVLRQYLTDFRISTGTDCNYSNTDTTGTVGSNCQVWKTAERTFPSIFPLKYYDSRGASHLSSRTDKMYFRLILKDYDSGCTGGTSCTSWYLTGLTANNGYKTYSNAPKYLTQEDDQIIYGDLNINGNLEVEGCIKYNCASTCVTLGSCV